MVTHTVTLEAKFDGTNWVDITRIDDQTYLMAGNERFITMTPGASDEGGFTPFTMEFEYRDDNAVLDGMNPASPYYGMIVPGTEMRIKKNGGVRGWAEFVSAEPRWDSDVDGIVVSVSCAGVSKRIEGEFDQPLESVARRTIGGPGNTSRVAYWPCEEESGADAIFSFDGQQAPPWLFGQSSISFGGDTDSLASKRLIRLGSGASVHFHPPAYTVTGETLVMALMRFPEAGLTAGARPLRVWVNGGTVTHVDWRFDSTWVMRLEVYNQGTLLGTIGPVNWVNYIDDGDEFHMRLKMTQDGADIDFIQEIVKANNDLAVAVPSGTLAGQTLGWVTRISMAVNGDCDGMSFGHLAMARDIDEFFPFIGLVNGSTGVSAFSRELAGRRLDRLSDEEGIPLSIIGYQFDTVAMGPQGPDTIMNLLREAVDADGGIIYDSPTYPEMIARTRVSLYNQVPTFLDYGHITPPFYPIADDRIVNDVKLQRSRGGNAQFTIADDDRYHWTTQAPPDGSRRKPGEITRNLASDDQNATQAAWYAHVNSWKAKRYSSIELNIDRRVFDSADVEAVEVMGIGDLLVFDTTNARKWVPYNEERILVRGYTEQLNQNLHIFTVNGSNADPYEVDTMDTGGSELTQAITNSQTNIWVATTRGFPWMANEEFNASINGDPVRVTGVADQVPSFVAAGTLSSADNGSVTPGLPAGMFTGDLMLLWVATRGSATINVPTGWNTRFSFGNTKLLYKYRESGESAPTVTFTGGSSGDTNMARIAAFANLSHGLVTGPADSPAVIGSNNSSAQNVNYPRLKMESARSAGAVSFLLFWKQDDWTSVATPSGFTLAFADTTTTGNDASLAMYYDLTPVEAGSGALVVTGGASAISRGVSFALRPTQILTTERGIAGVAVSHSIGDPVQAWRLGANGL